MIIFNKNKTFSRFLISFLIAIYITIPFNIYIFTLNNINESLSYIIPIIVTATVLGLIFSITKISLILYTFIISASTSGFWFIKLQYNVDTNLNLIHSIFNSNSREMMEHNNMLFILTVIVCSVLPSILVWFLKIKPLNIKNIFTSGAIKYFAKISVILLVLLILAYALNPRDLIYNKNKYFPKLSNFIPLSPTYYPVNFIQAITKYLLLYKGTYTYEDLSKYNFTFNNKNVKEPLIIVLFLGETARNANFSLNNYKRKTNPQLATVTNLVYYNNFTSCNTGTIASITCLLSYKDTATFREKLEYNYKNNIESIIDVFNLVGFTTNIFTTSSYRISDPIFLRFIKSKNIEYLSSAKLTGASRDEIILPALDKFFTQFTTTKNQQNQFIVIHTFGSHYKYNIRYNKDFEKFTPICHTKPSIQLEDCTQEQIINEYDNTVIYTDHILFETIKKLENHNALLIYTSDHGESLGENGIYYHGNTFSSAPKEQTNIPTFIWFSKKYLSYYGNNGLINAKSKITSPLDHTSIWHSLVSCSFITASTNIINKQISFC